MPPSPTDTLIDSASNWFRLKNRVATIIRVQNYFRDRNRPRPKYFTLPEFQEAEIAIIKYEQIRYYP